MSDVLFKDPKDGSFFKVDASEAAAAAADGNTPATEVQYQASQEPLQAAGEGFLRGVTLGFGDPLVAKVGEFTTGESQDSILEGMRLRKQENPWVAGGGEVVGNIATALATGGASEAVTAGLVARGVARGAARAAGALAEGGLMGLGSVVSEANLDRTPLNVEKMAAGVAGGALGGLGIHGVTAGIGKGISAGLSKLGGKTLAEGIDELGKKVEWNALTKGSKTLAERNGPFRDAILASGRESGVLGTASSNFGEEVAAKAQGAALQFSTKIAGQMDDLERVVPLKGNAPLRDKAVTYVEKRLESEFGSNPIFDDALKDVQKLTGGIMSRTGTTWGDFWKVQSSLFKDAPVTGFSPAARQVREEMRIAMRDFVFDEVATLPQVAPGIAAGMRKTGADARAAMTLSKMMANRAYAVENATAGANTSFGALLSLMQGNPMPLAAGVAADIGRNQVARRGALLTGAALRKLSPALESAAKGLEQRVGQVLATAPGVLGAARMPIEAAFGRGAMDLLQEHVRIAQGPDGPAYLASIGMTNETPEQVQGVGVRLGAMDALHGAREGLDQRIDTSINGFLGSKPGPRVPPRAPSVSDFEERTKLLRDTMADPTKAFESIPGELQAGAPGTAAALVDKLLQGVKFLDSRAPKDPYAGMPESIKPMWKPSASDVGKWYRYVEAVERPETMLDKMANGTFSLEHRDALRAVYPELYEDMKSRVYEKLSVWDKKVPYAKKATLAQFFGTEILGLKPGALQVLQGSFQPKPEDASPSKGGSRPDGRQNVDAGKLGLTEAQRMETR